MRRASRKSFLKGEAKRYRKAYEEWRKLLFNSHEEIKLDPPIHKGYHAYLRVREDILASTKGEILAHYVELLTERTWVKNKKDKAWLSINLSIPNGKLLSKQFSLGLGMLREKEYLLFPQEHKKYFSEIWCKRGNSRSEPVRCYYRLKIHDWGLVINIKKRYIHKTKIPIPENVSKKDLLWRFLFAFNTARTNKLLCFNRFYDPWGATTPSSYLSNKSGMSLCRPYKRSAYKTATKIIYKESICH